MKNLEKLDRQHLKTITGSGGDQCSTDLDSGQAGCAECT